MSTNHIRRIEAIEARNDRVAAVDVCARIARLTGLDPAELMAEAEVFAERIAWSGLDNVLDELAAEAGCTPAELRADLDRIEEAYRGEL